MKRFLTTVVPLHLTLSFLGACFVIGSFIVISPHKVHAATLDQKYYRFGANIDSQTPAEPWPAGGPYLAENQSITSQDAPPEGGTVLRIRMGVAVSVNPVADGIQYKLQYGEGAVCSTIASYDWYDVSGVGGTGIWRGYNNPTPADGEILSSRFLANTNVNATYEEENTAVVPPSGIAVGEVAEWDWVIQDNGAKAGTNYCFRMVHNNKSNPFNTYTDYPQLMTKAFVPKSQKWRWYGDESHETPTSSLSGEDIQPIGVRSLNPVKLRLTVKETMGTGGVNQKFSLQFSTSTDFSNATFVDEIGTCTSNSVWCFADGVDTDGDAITSFLLSDSGAKGTHNESGTSASTFTHTANSAVEYEFTIQSNGADPETIYYFRAYDMTNGQAVLINTGESYPSLKTFAQILQFSVTGLSAGTTIDSWTTDVTSTATTMNFGTLVPNVAKTSAHRLTVSADGLGYQIQIRYIAPFQNSAGDIISGIPYTNALPVAWTFLPTQSQSGVMGYHTTDHALSSGSTRFQAANTWAGLTDTGEEIVYTDGPVENEITDMLYRVETSPIQQAGSYSMDMIYIITPTY